ncbi:uncharacterized protein [Amphiura filiformis]|uniref:uncharacterized protein isoform X3 n=1 Tax=Amphiura filiformis TaxID=82378 RepID=UPI003B20BF27
MDILYTTTRVWLAVLCCYVVAQNDQWTHQDEYDAAKGVALDTCPEEYRSCNWACPRLVEDCPGGRTSADPCGCCSVCLRETGEHCALPKQPCDTDFGLVCNHGRCRGRMNLQVRSATLTSINLSWDDFLPGEYTSGQYVVYYTDTFSGYVAEWKGQQRVGNSTFTSIRELKSNTDYYFRVSYRFPTPSGIQLEGPLSEVALHRTGRPAPLGGCEDHGQHYDEGKTITQSCDSVCDCLLGTWICRPRGCPPEPDVVIIMNPINCRDVPHPDDPECCTIVQCDEGPTSPFGEADCVRDDQRHSHGETYNYGCEEVCYCDNGIESCTPHCQDPGVMIPDPETCPHPVLNPPPEGECCPYWSCPAPPGSCEMNGNTYEEDEYFDIECSMRCQCVSGSISCVPRCPLNIHPPILGCPNPKKVQVPGECCMQWECPQIPENPECTYVGPSVNITMKDGDWMDEGCESRCLCDRGSLVCMPMCARPSTPSPTPLCPNPVITKLTEDACCEVIACHDPKQPSPNVVRDVSVSPFNATTLTLGFTPPANRDLIKVMDGYNIYYTDHSDTENLDLSHWRVYRKDFPSGVQVRGHIIMDIHDLLRQTTYYLQIRVSVPDTTETRWPNTLPSSDTFIVTTVENEPQNCTFKSHVYEHKETFFDGCDSQCECIAGRTICHERCPQTELLASDACPNPQKVVVEGECCPEWRCFPSEGDCSYKDKIYSDGMEWRSGCDMRCTCNKGQVTCQNLCSSSPRLPASSKNCNYPVQVSVPDTCCKEWVCFDAPPTQDTLPSIPLPLSAFHVNISAVNVTAYNATITWPPLTDIQRKYIGEFMLKYKVLSYDGPIWDTTINFRPEVKQYTILDLRPARSYVVNLVVLVGNPTVAVTVNTNMLEIDTLWIPSKPYPGEPFDMEVFQTTDVSLGVRWEALPFEITESIIGWRLVVLDSYDSSIIESELVEPSALSYTLINLTESTMYHVQLLGLWDNGTLTREVRSKTLKVTTLGSSIESPNKLSSIPSNYLIIGLVIAALIILIPLAIFIYLRVKRRYSKRYDVYMQSTTVNYDKNATYEQMYDNNSVVELSHHNLQETGLHVRRDSEAGLLDAEHR